MARPHDPNGAGEAMRACLLSPNGVALKDVAGALPLISVPIINPLAVSLSELTKRDVAYRQFTLIGTTMGMLIYEEKV